MKHTILLLVILCTGLYTYGQTIVSYNYDKSGNRTSHTTTTIGLKSTSATSEETQSTESFSDQIGEHSILIYPNPVQSEITVEIQGLEDNSDAVISLFDQGGRLVLTREKIESSNTLNLSHLPSGTYFMIIRLGSGNSQWNIVKE